MCLPQFGDFKQRNKDKALIKVPLYMRIVGAYGNFENEFNPQFGFVIIDRRTLERL